MYISKCCAYPNFGTKIIDSHVHVGNLNGKYYDLDHLEPFFNKLPNGDKVEKMIVSDLDVLQGIGAQKDRTEYLIRHITDTDRYALLASCNVKEDANIMRNLITENRKSFVGLKFHPHLQNLPITDAKYKPYFQLASDFKLPCLIHSVASITNEGKLTGELEKFADPKDIYTVAKNYKETPFIMAHLGSGWKEAHSYTVDVLIESIKKGDANLYADFSWVDIDYYVDNKASKENLISAIKRLKGIGEENWTYGDQSFRLLFGSDAPVDRFSDKTTRIKEYNRFIEEIKTAIRNDSELHPNAENIIDDLFYNNTKNLYKLKGKELPARKIPAGEKALNYLSKNWSKFTIGAGALFIGAMALCYHSDYKEKNKPNLSLVG